ncbi:MAG: hypothetical protein PF795_08575 [Kiritimatiellae bacterium]|jgi:hypothetical protein|nr:hypothetical protein [Kiritimatiellia bacterium]
MKLYPVERFLLFFLFFHLLLGIFLANFNMEYFESVYVMEDGVIEWFTTDALLFCSFLCGFRFFQLRKVRPPLFRAMLLFLTLLFFFGAGEELSWGQRILNVESSEFFLENNAQGETNFHNLVVGETKINKIIFSQLLGISIILYICVFPWVSLKVEWVRRLANRFAVPIPRLIHIIACLLMALTYVLELMPSSKKGEMLEFGNCFVFFMILLYPRNSEIYDPNVKLDPPA